MKMSFKSIVLTSILGFGLTLGFTQLLNKKNQEPAETVNKVAEYKAKSREKIKPHRYDGSKITHFTYGTYETQKSVEVLLFNGIEYKFCFNTDGVPKSIDIKIYDKENTKVMDKDGKEIPRILLFEANGIMQKDVMITSDAMLKTLQEKKNVSSLKKVYIVYEVPIGDKAIEAPAPEPTKIGEEPAATTERGVVVVSFGYKNV